MAGPTDGNLHALRQREAEREAHEDAKVAMQECLDRWSEQDDPPPHQFQG